MTIYCLLHTCPDWLECHESDSSTSNPTQKRYTTYCCITKHILAELSWKVHAKKIKQTVFSHPEKYFSILNNVQMYRLTFPRLNKICICNSFLTGEPLAGMDNDFLTEVTL